MRTQPPPPGPRARPTPGERRGDAHLFFNGLLAVLAIGALASCASPADTSVAATAVPSTPTPATPQTLATSIIGDPQTFNPILAADSASRAALGEVFDTLVRLDPETTEAEPNLAESWECSADGRECLFQLQGDARWQDGTPLTAADVVFTFDVIQSEAARNSFASFLTVDGKPLRAEAVGERSVRFRLPRPFAPLLRSLAVPILPRHLLAKSLEENTFTQQWGVDTPPDRIVGTGPFRIAEYRPGELLRLRRSANHWRRDAAGLPLPYLDEHVIYIAADQEAQRELFLSGTIQVYSPALEEVARLREQAARLDVTVAEVGVDTGTVFLTFNRNPDRPGRDGASNPRSLWFTDRRFLIAVAHSIDKRALIAGPLLGLGRPAVSYLSPANRLFHDTQLEDYAYDPELARRSLDEAGYKQRPGEQIRRDPKGNPLEFELSTNADNKTRGEICGLLVKDLAAVGIRARFRPLDFPTLFEKLDTTYDWDALVIGSTGGVDPSSGENLLRSSGPLHVWRPSQTKPATPWEADIDRLLDAGSRQLDPTKRRDIYWKIQQLLHDELPMIQLVRPMRFTAYSNTLHNFHPAAWGVERPEELRRVAPVAAARPSAAPGLPGDPPAS